MRALKVAVHLLPDNRSDYDPVRKLRLRAWKPVEAEVIDISSRLCRLRVARDGLYFDGRHVCIRFARTEVVARVIWTNTSEQFIELGLLLPGNMSVPQLDAS